ncbi:MAG TPA: flagellar motor switch protein FliG [Desulfomonilia bacterium]
METTFNRHTERFAADNVLAADANSMPVSFFKKFHYISLTLIVSLTVLVIVFAVLLFMSVNTSRLSAAITGRENMDTTPRLSNQGVEAKQMIEDSLEKRAQDILDRLLGPGKALVTINADIDMEVVKRVRGKEAQGSSLSSGMNEAAENPYIVTEYIQAPGEIRRLSVSVIVDGSYSKDKSGKKIFVPAAQSEIMNIETVLKQALGFDETRDDTIAVTSMPLIRKTSQVYESGLTGSRIFNSLPILSIIIIAVLALLLACFIYLNRKNRAGLHIPGSPAVKYEIKETSEEKTESPQAKTLIAESPDTVKTGATDVEAYKENETGPFSTLNHVDVSILSDYLKGEHPQTIAVVLSHLPGNRSARILGSMPEKIQGEVIFRMANMGIIPRVVIDELEQVLKRDIEAMGAYEGRKLGGVDYVADIMNHLDINTENIIFASLEDVDPLLADRIRQKMFVFDDIMNIDSRGIQTLLKEITNEDLILALKTANDELKEKIFTNMSSRAAEMLKEDLESMGPVRIADVETAQQNIIRIARKLERLGRLVIAGKGREDVLV